MREDKNFKGSDKSGPSAYFYSVPSVCTLCLGAGAMEEDLVNRPNQALECEEKNLMQTELLHEKALKCDSYDEEELRSTNHFDYEPGEVGSGVASSGSCSSESRCDTITLPLSDEMTFQNEDDERDLDHSSEKEIPDCKFNESTKDSTCENNIDNNDNLSTCGDGNTWKTLKFTVGKVIASDENIMIESHENIAFSNVVTTENIVATDGNVMGGNVHVVGADERMVAADEDAVPSDGDIIPTHGHEEENCFRKHHLDFNATPIQLTGAWRDFETSENFLKGCKWSPDGTCILTCSDDNIFKLFNLPIELYSESSSCNCLPEMSSVLNMREGETIYDYAWYPNMSSYDPNTCCFISSCRDHPLHLWDAFNGQIRCSYRAYNQMDEITSPHCVAFNLDGSKIFCGFNKTVRVFDTCRPGRQCEQRATVAKKYGQSGIISCITFAPDNSGLYACGSFTKSVGIYCEPKGSLMSLVEGHQGGVTHLLFSPDGQRLYSGGRKDKDIICWDMRFPGAIVHRLVRSVTTNQRMYFDLDSSGKYLISGNSDGSVSIWDTTQGCCVGNHLTDVVNPVHLNYTAHDDCVNGISLHPTLPVLATASGQRRFVLKDEVDDYDGENESVKSDCSLRLWRISVKTDLSV